MAYSQKTSKTINVALWVAQILLSVSFGWSAWLKLIKTVPELAAMWPWANQVSEAFIRGIGIAEVIIALGLVLPAWLRIKPMLTPIAALSAVLLMICAGVFHIVRGEAGVIGVNIVFALIALFIAWGRFKKAPVLSK